MNILEAIKKIKQSNKPLYFSVKWAPDDSSYFKGVKSDFLEALVEASKECITIEVNIEFTENGIFVN